MASLAIVKHQSHGKDRPVENRLFRRLASGICPCTNHLVDLHGRSFRRDSLWYCSLCIRWWHHLWCPEQRSHRLWGCVAASADLLYRWCQIWKVSLSLTKSVVAFFSRDLREVNGSYFENILETTQVPFEPTPRLLGITLDCPTVSFLSVRIHWRSRRKCPVV